MAEISVKQYRLPRKGLKIAHININSIRNKIHEITEILNNDNIHVLAISETHLDSTFDDSALSILGYNIFRRDRNSHGGGVAFFIQEHIAVKIRKDLMCYEIETIWLQFHLPHSKPMLVGCCYRPPTANSMYLDEICRMIEDISVMTLEIYLTGDFNIDWFSNSCSLKNKLLTATNTCGFHQLINKPTRTCYKYDGITSSTCIDHIFTNAPELCLKSISVPTGCSDHNLIAVVRSAKINKPGPKVIMRRS